MCATCFAYFIFLKLVTLIILVARVEITRLLIKELWSVSCHLLPLMYRYSLCVARHYGTEMGVGGTRWAM
jgi:hypothetical protein